jgi:hypothetical protein
MQGLLAKLSLGSNASGAAALPTSPPPGPAAAAAAVPPGGVAGQGGSGQALMMMLQRGELEVAVLHGKHNLQAVQHGCKMQCMGGELHLVNMLCSCRVRGRDGCVWRHIIRRPRQAMMQRVGGLGYNCAAAGARQRYVVNARKSYSSGCMCFLGPADDIASVQGAQTAAG